jgi:cysteinyl-tRNA synthetase
MEDYFNYDMFVVMNITDVDDKIILKARRMFLLQKYKDQNQKLTEQVGRREREREKV